jgi:hypothetical protein
MSAADDTAEVLRILTETKCREMGHVDAESLIESLRQQFHEGLVMLTEPVPAGSVITTSATL